MRKSGSVGHILDVDGNSCSVRLNVLFSVFMPEALRVPELSDQVVELVIVDERSRFVG
jgi:hypothetical protein